MKKLILNRDDAVSIGIGCGWKSCGKWDKERLTKRIVKVATEDEFDEIQFEEDDFEDDDLRDRFNELLTQMREAGENIEITQKKESGFVDEEQKPKNEEDVEESLENDSNEEEETKQQDKSQKKDETKPTKSTQEENTEEKPERKTRNNGKKDQFGHRVGSQASNINQAILSEPMTVAEISDTLRLKKTRVASHVYELQKKGLVTKNNDKKIVVAEEA